MFDYSKWIGKDLNGGLHRIAGATSRDALARGLVVDSEEIASELYMHILANKAMLDYPLGKALSILRGVANKYSFSQRNVRNGYMYSSEDIILELKKWTREGMSSKVSDALYSESFLRAGVPAGSYFSVVQEAYQGGYLPAAGSNEAVKLGRAISRLAEMVSGVMTGVVLSLDVVGTEVISEEIEQPSLEELRMKYAPDMTLEELEAVMDAHQDRNDPTFRPHAYTFMCDQGHSRVFLTAVAKSDFPNRPRIGTAEHGYKDCWCGLELPVAK